MLVRRLRKGAAERNFSKGFNENPTAKSIQPEADLDVELHSHRLAIFASGLEDVLPGGVHGLLVQAHTQRADHPHVVRLAIGAHHHPQYAHSLIAGLARLFGKFRIGLVENAGCAYATHAGFVDAAAGAAAFARSDAGADAGAHAAARSGANATARADAVRGRAFNFGSGHADVGQI